LDESPNPYDPQAVPEPAKKPGGRIPRLALAGGIAVGLALGGAGLAYAASSGSSSTSGPSASGTSSTTAPANGNKPEHPLKGRHLGFGALGVGGSVVHGTVTVHSGSGYKTVDVQSGQVTNVDSSSITVKSSDGYTHTYAVISSTIVNSQAGGISSVAQNDQVYVMATPQNGTDTAANIIDTSKIQNSRGAFGFPTQPKPNSATGWTGGGPDSFGGQFQA
jgi:hypothetical protein